MKYKYTFVCKEPHEPEELVVEASTDEEALTKMKALGMKHMMDETKHPKGSVPTMTEEETEAMFKSGWTKAPVV